MKQLIKIKKKIHFSYYIVSVCAILSTLSSTFFYKKAYSAFTEREGHGDFNIYESMEWTEADDVDFGTINMDPAGGNVSIDYTDGSISCGVHDCSTGLPHDRGRFYVTDAPPSPTCTFTYTNGTLSDGTNTITFTPSGPSSQNVSTSPNIYVGGTLAIQAGQPEGDYSTGNTGGSPYTITAAF